MRLTLPTNYFKLLKGRVLIITGVGRSGTSLLGKICGSFQRTVYLFEPAFMKYLMFNYDRRVLRAVLLEDYFLPIMQGRYRNENKEDQSWAGNYTSWAHIPRREDALAAIQEQNPLFIIKTNEFQPLLDRVEDVFPKAKILHIIRNGNDVVNSSLSRGWYTDLYLHTIQDWAQESRGVSVPWYLNIQDKAEFARSDQVTRCSIVWRSLSGYSTYDTEGVKVVRYEDILSKPLDVVSELGDFLGRRKTDLTMQHVKALKPRKQYADITDKIALQERRRFTAAMQRLGY